MNDAKCTSDPFSAQGFKCHCTEVTCSLKNAAIDLSKRTRFVANYILLAMFNMKLAATIKSLSEFRLLWRSVRGKAAAMRRYDLLQFGQLYL